ncbi:hypothetical protein C9374_003213 [Naegleria lovaniensis]|uniref:SAP domain-containing protein n=1 Tax=Naegleria lovaniensis TaxID=51637 RepID=A0AA88KLR0_NAELO|nr:uncharacterized protein C9374_003213 [Naegleria lovaniensis]KAG2386064.1 hypothetical protein C9374_003213 [Naegleria lovaniensis]
MPSSTVDSLSKFLQKFELGVLKTMAQKALSETKQDDVQELSNDLIDWAYEQGIKKFIGQLDASTLKKSMAEAGVKDIDANGTKEALGERFLDGVEQDEGGPEGFLSKMEIATLKNFVKILGFETDAKDQQQYAEDISDELLLNGTRMLFDFVDGDTLKHTAKKLNLKVPKSASKSVVQDILLNEVFPGLSPEEEEKPKKEKKSKKSSESSAKQTREEMNEKIKRERPDLPDCKTFDDIFQNYWVDELRDFCKKNDIKSQGNKKDLIKRIIAFNEDPNNKGFTEKKRKRKTGKSSSKKEKKEHTTTNGDASASSTPKEE